MGGHEWGLGPFNMQSEGGPLQMKGEGGYTLMIAMHSWGR